MSHFPPYFVSAQVKSLLDVLVKTDAVAGLQQKAVGLRKMECRHGNGTSKGEEKTKEMSKP